MISNGRAAASSGNSGTGRPVLLAIAGDRRRQDDPRPGSRLSSAPSASRASADDYHRYDRKERARLRITPLDPQCNYLDVIEQHLRLLADGEAILKPRYDHGSGTFLPPVYVRPREFVLIEGLLPLHTRAMRDSLDVKVFLDPEEDLRRQWKIDRDCATRGYSPDQVVAEMERREHDTATYIRPQRAHGDIVVRFHRPRRPSPDGHLAARVVLRPTHASTSSR
jgi:phosphoribulokinase